MPRPLACLIAVVALALLGPVAVARGNEQKVLLRRVPQPVLEAVVARFAEAEMIGASKETEDGKLVYEVAIKHEGQNIEVSLTRDGTILAIEKEIAAGDLPEAVTKALEAKHAEATYKIIEEIIDVENQEEKPAYYEVLLVRTDKRVLEVQVTAEGQIVNEENKDSDKEDGE